MLVLSMGWLISSFYIKELIESEHSFLLSVPRYKSHGPTGGSYATERLISHVIIAKWCMQSSEQTGMDRIGYNHARIQKFS